MMKNSYVLVTAARNEEAYIEKTIQSVVNQTILPKRWVIVSDGSTDRTDEIVSQYAANYGFIKLVHAKPQGKRNYASKVNAIKVGFRLLKSVEYDFIGNLDADVSFGPDNYECILRKFEKNARLGIAGGIIFDFYDGGFQRQFASVNSVGGPIQLFRLQCYQDIGGYIPLKKGGVDAIAEVMARMNGWEVRSFPEIRVMHHRRTGTEKGHILSARFRQGVMEYSHGNHPLFEMAKCVSRIREKPYVFGSLFRLLGYNWAFLRRDKREVADEVVKFLRREQIQRLFAVLPKSKSR